MDVVRLPELGEIVDHKLEYSMENTIGLTCKVSTWESLGFDLWMDLDGVLFGGHPATLVPALESILRADVLSMLRASFHAPPKAP